MGSIVGAGQQQASSDQSASQGAQAGMLNGLLSKKRDGTDSGNLFVSNQNQQRNNQSAQDAIYGATNYQGSQDALNPLQSSRTATDEVGNNSILGQVLGKGGTLDRTTAQEQDLAGRGFSLQPEDYEAYGQASDNIARQFGTAGGSLGQALSDRGLSDSAGAGQSFSGLQGNKLEQLGQMQQQIAKQRMDTNMQRLGQTRQFLGQLTGEASNDIQQQYGRQMGSEAANYGETMGKANQATNFLQNAQGQANEQMSQRQQSAGVDTRGGIFGAMGSGYFNGQVAGRSGGGGGGGGWADGLSQGGKKKPAQSSTAGTESDGSDMMAMLA